MKSNPMTSNPTIPEPRLLARVKQINSGTHDAGRVRAPHGLRFPHEQPQPWACLLRLNDVVQAQDHISDASLDALVAENAGQRDGHWEVLQATRALLRAEGLR